MSNKRFNFVSKAKSPYHEFQLPAGKYSDILVSDFFNFVDGKVGELRIVKVTNSPNKMEIDAMSDFLSACQIEWERYCLGHSLPGESNRLLKSKIAKQWKIRKNSLERSVPSRNSVK